MITYPPPFFYSWVLLGVELLPPPLSLKITMTEMIEQTSTADAFEEPPKSATLSSCKRKCMDDDDDKVLTLTNHREAECCQCVCGYKVGSSGTHACTVDIKEKVKLVFALCDRGTCQVCIEWMDRKKKLENFENQWYQDRDGYTRCDECDAKCDGEIPKDCGCEWYIDEEGVDRCNTCHYNDYCREALFCCRCRYSWYHDENDRAMCSTCNKEIKYKSKTDASDVADDSCQHWYMGEEDIQVCGKCHTTMWTNSRYCEKCGNDTSYKEPIKDRRY